MDGVAGGGIIQRDRHHLDHAGDIGRLAHLVEPEAALRKKRLEFGQLALAGAEQNLGSISMARGDLPGAKDWRR